MYSLYASLSMSFSSSSAAAGSSSTLAIQPPPGASSSGSLLMVAGFSSSRSLTWVTVQLRGALMSLADLTDSTAPRASPWAKALPTSGSST